MRGDTHLNVSAALLSISLVVAVNAAIIVTLQDVQDVQDENGWMARDMDLGDNNYTNYNGNATYIMKVSFDPKGMDGVYSLTKIFMDLVQPSNFKIKGKGQYP